MGVKVAVQTGLASVIDAVESQYHHMTEQQMRLQLEMPPHQKSIRLESEKLEENNK